MPLQNRVDPFGAIRATPERGTVTGNRGVLHNSHRQLVRTHQSKRWIACLLDYGGVRRRVMAPNRWTELFFLDEATALAAGHRPCFFCRHDDALRFATLWNETAGVAGRARADDMDRELHLDRMTDDRADAGARALPVGAMITDGSDAFIVVGGGVCRWSFSGYGPVIGRPDTAWILTPLRTLDILDAGYAAGLHPSAR